MPKICLESFDWCRQLRKEFAQFIPLRKKSGNAYFGVKKGREIQNGKEREEVAKGRGLFTTRDCGKPGTGKNVKSDLANLYIGRRLHHTAAY